MRPEVEATGRRFFADSDLISNNWKENPHGDIYRQRLLRSRRSDLYRRHYRLLAPKIDQVNASFSEKYGWGEPGRHLSDLDPASTAPSKPVDTSSPRYMPDTAMDALPSGEGAVEKRVPIPRRGKGGNIPDMLEIRAALDHDRRLKAGVGDKLKTGDPVGLRIDIPAFERTLTNPVSKTGEPTYAISVHGKWKGGKGGRAGTVIGYENMVRVKDPVFTVNEKAAEGIKGGKPKTTIATVEGSYVKSKIIPEGIKSWTQAGMNPKRHSYFYDRATGEPVTGGSEALSIGGTVFVKDATFGSKSDFRYMPDIGQTDALGMFSAAERATVDLKQEKGSASQMLAMIKKAGVKDEELQSLGLAKFLEGNRKVTKDEIIDHLVENSITVEETVLWNREGPNADFALPETIHDSYVEPGAVEGSYRELLLRLPPDEPGYRSVEDTDMYTAGHYGDYPNVLAHVRFNERDSLRQRAGGVGRTLFIEEIQSDWHQAGRKKGYKTDVDPAILKKINDLKKAEDKLDSEIQAKSVADDVPQHIIDAGESADGLNSLVEFIAESNRNDPRYQKREAIMAERMSLESQVAQRDTVPDAPFKTSWHELSMKRMISYAAEEGYDAIAWTKGETQAKRYDLSKQVDEVWYEKHEDGTYSFDVVGKEDAADLMSHSRVGADVVEANIGKEMLVKMDAGKGTLASVTGRQGTLEPVWTILRGEDLKVGGEGMKGFYDRMLPRMKMWKKLGLKVETGLVTVGKRAHEAMTHGWTHAEWVAAGKTPSLSAHLVKLTPEVKAKVLDTGIARFMPDASVPGAEKNSIGWSMLLTKSGNWRVYGPDGVLAGVAGSKQRAEQIFKTKYKRELRKKERSSSVRYMPDARSEYRAAEIPHRSSVPGVPDGVELRLPTVETTTGSVGKGKILHFSAYPSGRYGAMRYGVAATEANRFPSDAKGEMPKDGGYDSVWDERYNRSYDSEQKWRAAHARYAKKNEIISDPWYESAIRVEEEIKKEKAK
jgi:hypothetical protein